MHGVRRGWIFNGVVTFPVLRPVLAAQVSAPALFAAEPHRIVFHRADREKSRVSLIYRIDVYRRTEYGMNGSVKKMFPDAEGASGA